MSTCLQREHDRLDHHAIQLKVYLLIANKASQLLAFFLVIHDLRMVLAGRRVWKRRVVATTFGFFYCLCFLSEGTVH